MTDIQDPADLTLAQARAAMEAGRLTAAALVEASLARIADPAGEGARAFVAVEADAARRQAAAMDALRRVGRAPPWAGIPVGIKDLFDVAGAPTRAGSAALAEAAPAAATAPAIARLLAAGFVPVGRNSMTEFAFSGLGLNDHTGTPLGPWQRASGHIPGGSSSGAGVSVGDRMVPVAIGTDTGGSCRLPAAFCGVVGYKPTARRVPREGVLPLSTSLDSVGPLARSVACCAITDAILAGETPAPPAPAPVAGLRLAVPDRIVLDDADDTVAAAFDRARRRLEAAGARIVPVRFPALDRIAPAYAAGGLAAAESFAWHRSLLATRAGSYDPRVRVRIERGAAMSAADYVDLLAERRAVIRAMDEATEGWDALLMPTAPVAPPRIASLADPAAYTRVNALVLRNPTLANFLDRCAISLPCHAPGEPPVGLGLMGETMGDRRLFAIAAAVEATLAA